MQMHSHPIPIGVLEGLGGHLGGAFGGGGRRGVSAPALEGGGKGGSGAAVGRGVGGGAAAAGSEGNGRDGGEGRTEPDDGRRVWRTVRRMSRAGRGLEQGPTTRRCHEGLGGGGEEAGRRDESLRPTAEEVEGKKAGRRGEGLWPTAAEAEGRRDTPNQVVSGGGDGGDIKRRRREAVPTPTRGRHLGERAQLRRDVEPLDVAHAAGRRHAQGLVDVASREKVGDVVVLARDA